ncbi:hypothetical protein CDAR_539831 [Caerostris darwini]|uniref:Uncharacterized protein n=1 Tax=Caerostris darwini TaxID=1538125 RepID=A0AAV4RCJ7_9ARAC|nr:hypothetical protein CDAR_539831 [Caerostris darwini]
MERTSYLNRRSETSSHAELQTITSGFFGDESGSAARGAKNVANCWELSQSVIDACSGISSPRVSFGGDCGWRVRTATSTTPTYWGPDRNK